MSGKKLLQDERKKIRTLVGKEAASVTNEVELLVCIVKQLNEGLIDDRLETKKGLLQVLDELRQYSKYLDKGLLILLNGDTDRSGEIQVWFEA
jgi:hypothetical protein